MRRRNAKDRLFQLIYQQTRELLARLDRVGIPALPSLVMTNSLLHIHRVAVVVHLQQVGPVLHLVAPDWRTEVAQRPSDPI